MSEAAHVRAGGSKIHRIIACPASMRLEKEAGPEKRSGDDAKLGTTAHTLLEKVARLGTDGGAAGWMGYPFLTEGTRFVVDGDMIEAVQVALDWLDSTTAAYPDAIVRLEQRVDWADLKPPEPMRGSADIIVAVPSEQLLIVADYKHGIGEVVEVAGNPQGRFYAVGALLHPDFAGIEFDRVQITIIQPRAWHTDGPVRSEVITVGELWVWAAIAKEAVRIGGLPDAPAHAGKHCKFCRAAATCATRADAVALEAQEEFGSQMIALPPAKLMDPAELAALLQRVEPVADRAQLWVDEARAYLHARASSGEKVPGYKLVPKRPARVWNRIDEVRTWAELESGLAQDDYMPRELVSPAQMEKLVGKKNVPADLYSSVSSGTNLVLENAEGTPVARLSAADEFTVEAGEPNV